MARETIKSIKQIWKQEFLDRLGDIVPRKGFYCVDHDVTFLKRKKDVDCISIVWGQRYFYSFNHIEQKIMGSVMDVLEKNFKPMNFSQHQETLNRPVFQWVFVYASTKKDLKRLQLWLDAYIEVCADFEDWRLSGYALCDPLELIKNLKVRDIAVDSKIYDEIEQKLSVLMDEVKKMYNVEMSLEKLRKIASCHWVRESIDALNDRQPAIHE